MKASIYFFLGLFLAPLLPLFAQTEGDFRTAATGEWTSTAIWQRYDGSSWVAATNYPTATDGYIIITGGKKVSIPASVSITADQVLVQENAEILIAKDGTLELVNGPGTDLDISNAVNLAVPGTVKIGGLLKVNEGAIIASTASTLIIESGGTYQHHYTMSRGAIPSANWNEGSNLLISGYTSNELAPQNLGQSFHNVIWNTPDLNITQGFINLGGALKTVNGNLTVSSTGAGLFSLASESSTDILNIGQNFRIEGGSNVQLNSLVQVTDTLVLSNSRLENISGLSLASEATFLLEGTNELSGVSPAAQGNYSLYYKNFSTNSPGLEFPNPETGLANLKIESSTLYLTSPLTVNGNLILEPLGTLGLNNTNLFLKGNFTNNGNLAAGTNKVIFNGQAPQKIEGTSTTTFYDLEISNTASPGLTANAHINIERSLILGENVTFDPDGGDLATDGGINVTLTSTALNKAAFLAPLPATAQVAGNLVLQHFIPPVPMFRYLTTATKELTLRQWADDFKIYGNFNGGLPGNASMYIYDEPQGTFFAFPGTSGSLDSPIEVGKGYTAYIDEATTPVIIDTRGPVQSGNYSFPLTYTESSPSPGDNQVGNPYPSVIEWASPHWQRQNVSPSIRIYKRVSGKNVYSILNAVTGIGTNAENTQITSGQAFFTEAFGPNPILSATESVKIATANKPAIQDVIVVSLKNQTFQDQTVLAFREGATANYEGAFDSKKIKNSSINLYSLSPGGRVIAQNVQPWFDCNLTFPLVIDQAPADIYQLSFSHLESLSKQVNIILQDSYENKSVPVTPSTVYSFTITSDPLTYGPDRFKLIIGYAVPEITSITYQGSCNGEIPVTVTGTVAGKNYQLFSGTTALTDPVAATSESTSFMVPASSLSEGNNTISIQGFHTGCEPVTMATELQLDYSGSYTISSTEGATSCTTGAVTLTAIASTERASYKWYESLEATTPVHEATTGSFTTPALEQNTTYYVAAVNTYGCESNRVAVEAVILATPEVSAVSYEGSCNGEIPVTVTGTVAGKNYQLFSGTTALTDPVAATSESTSFMVPASSLSEGNNTISIQGFHTGCEPVTMATELQLDYSGSYTISSTEGATSCTTGAVTLTAIASTERASYKWYESLEANTPVHEATTGSFTTPALEQNTTYYVAAVNTYGCESNRVAVEATILNLEKPVIQLEDEILKSNYATGNQWFFNGTPIANATASSFTPTESGTYGLKVNSNDCILLADAVEFAVTGIEVEKTEEAFKLYPNPTEKSFQIKGSFLENTKIIYTIYQHNGTIVQQGSISDSKSNINIESLNAGLYLVKIIADEKVYCGKLIKY